MKVGKISETVYKRSILKEIVKQQNSVLTGIGVGESCAVFSCDKDKFTLASVSNSFKEDICELVILSVNRLVSKGAEPVAVLIDVLMPENFEETYIKAQMEKLKDFSSELKIEVAKADFKVSSKVKEPVINVTAIGFGAMEEKADITGNDIIITKWVGLEGTAMIAKYKEQELAEKFPARFIYEAGNFDKNLSCIPEAAVAIKSGATGLTSIQEGGVFASLWEMAAGHHVGLKIELKKIPIKQETIEICNYFDLNPYQILSGGSMIITTEDGSGLCMKLENEGIHAVVVGKVIAGNDRTVYSDDFERFLEPAKADELYKIFN